MQINYGYNLDSLKSNLVYNAETQTVSIPAEALRLQLLLLAPTAENGAVSTVSPEFVYRVAGSVGDNEAIKVILEKQHKDFSSKDISSTVFSPKPSLSKLRERISYYQKPFPKSLGFEFVKTVVLHLRWSL